MIVKKWQTRNEAGGLEFFKTKDEAWKKANEDKTIWKVSGEGHRYVRQQDGTWTDEPMEKIVKETIEAYKKLRASPEQWKKFAEELEIWDEAVGDGIDSE